MSVSIYCPYCHKHTDLRIARFRKTDHDGISEYTRAITNEFGRNVWWIGICNACGHPVLVEAEGQTIYPSPLPSPTNKAIPMDLRADLDEAKMCLAVNCYRACCVLARRCVQLACIRKGAKEKDLVAQIKELADLGLITKDLADWAAAIRWIGNDSARPDSTTVEKIDAEDSLKLAEQFLHVLFVTTALAEERKVSRWKNK